MKPSMAGAALGGLLLAYAVLGLLLPNAPLQDVPNHLARASIIADMLLGDGAVHGNDFLLQIVYRPYLTGDLVLAALNAVIGSPWTARLWITTAILAIPLGAWFALRSLDLPQRAVMTGVMLSLLPATGWHFVMGFLNFQVAIGCALFTYGWFVRAQSSREPHVWFCYGLLALISYAMHLSALVFICAFVGTTLMVLVARRRVTIARALLLLAVPCMLLGLHLVGDLLASSHARGATSWGQLHGKIVNLFTPVIRFERRIDLLLFAALLAASFVPVLFTRFWRELLAQAHLWLCALAFVGLYFVLPFMADNIFYVDSRALPYALLFLLFIGVVLVAAAPRQLSAQLAGAALVAVLNLVWVGATLLPQDRALGQYREIAADIPAGSRVLPVNTRAPIGPYRPFQHAGAYATVDAAAWTPYLFAGDVNPPMTYFNYAGGRGYFPDEFWYEYAIEAAAQGRAVRLPDWQAVAREYDYLLVTEPWDPSLVPPYFKLVARNQVAALLETSRP